MQNGVLTGDYTCNVHAGEGGLDAFFLWNNREGMEYITYTGNFDSEGKALVEQAFRGNPEKTAGRNE